MGTVADSTVRQLGDLARTPLAPGAQGAAVLDVAGRLLPHDGYALIGLDPLTGLRTFLLSRNGVGTARDLAQHEFRRPDVNLYSDLARSQLPVGVTNATDTLGARSARMRLLLEPAGYTSELRLVLRVGCHVWGILWLVRSDAHRPFNQADAGRAFELAHALSTVVRRFTVRPADPIAALDAATAVLDVDDSMTMATAGFPAWLADLIPGGANDVTETDVLRILFDASNAVRTSGQPVRSCLRTSSGRWANLTAEPLDGAPGSVVLTLAQATPSQVLPAFACWNGLTAREQAALQLVISGESTKGVARRLGISRYTAEDHLRAVYLKTGCPGREALMGALAG